ncbi:MAG: Arylsulfatase [candidate division BRC1 bacterium ADurb.BinA364]|nr:MAG: Arylsulfatase [candidate division BRC1 bacterium ADurb.BinA364]
MKAIFIVSDTFRKDHLGAYGNTWIRTPNLDGLAAMSNVFDNYYIGSFPTLPNRRDMHLGLTDVPGRLPLNPWRGVDAGEITLAERLYDNRVHTMMVNDVANSCLQSRNMPGKVGFMNLHKGFEFFIGNRGQEADNVYSKSCVPLEFPVEPHLIRYPAEGWHRVLMNRSSWQVEEDFFAPKTFKIASEWLEHNYKRDNFLLWVETFDPHEPWDPPQWYIDMYDPGYTGRIFEAPTYGKYKEMGITARELKQLRARYAAECTMVDFAVGRLLTTLERLSMLDEVAIFFTTDHGTYMGYDGDNDLICKPYEVGADGMAMSGGGPMKKPSRKFAQFTGVTNIPLFIHMPGQKKGKRIGQIAQPWDIKPTVLDLFGLKCPPELIGGSLLPVIEGKKKATRSAAICGAPQSHFQAMTADWAYTVWPFDEIKPMLIDRKNDKSQSKNVASKNPGVCQKLHKEIVSFVKAQKHADEKFLKALGA